ncbi:hypothetical protein [Emticicia sp.]|uniref:hypothetical protein n=1 Tax=Emticicia sp. TaxID=1930953 RepID=UPI003753535F
MKKLFLFLSLTVILFSCRKEQETPDLGNTIWVNAKYLESLERTKSPLQAKIYADTVMVNFNANADTANIVWNFHESSEFIVKKGDKIQLFNAYEEKKTPEFEGILVNGTLKLGKSTFKKVDTIGFIEKKFWIGKYSAGSNQIELKFDGKISGIDSLATYYVWSDYITTQTDIDLIDFYAKNNKSTTYGYKFVGNEIIFYDFIWNETDQITGKVGKEMFRWRQI